MGASTNKRYLQAALALTLLTCSGLAGCSGSQEQGGSNAGSGKAAVAAGARAKTATVTPKAKSSSTPTVAGAPTATASPTITMTPELKASKKRALATPPPPKPELITVNSDDGAIATAKYWVQLDYYIYTTGKTSEYQELCPGSTYIATKPIEKMKDIHTKGGWSDPVTIKFTKAFRRSDIKNHIVIQVEFERAAFAQYNGNGNIEQFDTQMRWAGVRVEYNGTQWIVVEAVNHADQ